MTKKNCEPENIMELTKEFCEICNFDPDSIQEEFGFINVLRAVVEWYKREEHKSEIKCVADMCSIFLLRRQGCSIIVVIITLRYQMRPRK